MKYEEVKYEDIKDIIKPKEEGGYADAGPYGKRFAPGTAALIRQITKEDGWHLVKVIYPESMKAEPGWEETPRDIPWMKAYYFINDKHKICISVSADLWETDGFQEYLDKAKK